MSRSLVDLGGRQIGPWQPCFVIAEAGVNHDGSMRRARALVDAAAAAGADAVKFQTFRADRVASRHAPKAAYQLETTGAGESQLDMIRRLELPFDAFRELKTHCDARGILFLSTPADLESAAFLDALGVPAFKIGSGEVTNLPLLADIARRGRPLLLSTGMATFEEVEAAVATIAHHGDPPLALFHCVTSYPAPAAEANLRAMLTLAERFDVPVGFSDHTLGIEVALAAAALGAAMLEKHLTLDRSLPGPDHRASAEPDELARLVRGVRTVEAALGHGRKEPSPGEREIARVARRSLAAARDLRAGARLDAASLTCLRPGTGFPPSALPELVGRTLREDVPAGTLLVPGHLG